MRNKILPSIFNDVIGPVMRGPSSSHCAGALRIGRLVRDLMNGKIDEAFVEFDSEGSLATTHKSQGSDMGLFAGLLGWEVTDERLSQSTKFIREAGIHVQIKISDFDTKHPNTYKLILKNSKEKHQILAISVGGGIVEIIEIDGVKVSIAGDYFEVLIFTDEDIEKISDYLKQNVEIDEIIPHKNKNIHFVEIKGQTFLSEKIIEDLYLKFQITSIKKISPVLSVLSRKNIQVPFTTCQEMLEYNASKNLVLWELAVAYESARGNLSEDEVFDRMKNIVEIINESIEKGIQGTSYKDRILGAQSPEFQKQMEKGNLLDGGMLNRMILYISALMEVKSSMGIIVAAPTAGSCGGLPGAVLAAAKDMGFSTDQATKAMLAAGIIGVFIASQATFAAEEGGCQAECGAGSGMTAAALVTLAGGTVQQAVDGVSMSLQNVLGMICDPVANRVEVPCLGKNVMAAANALACANMALADYDAVIPLDEVIDTMHKVGPSLPKELRCTTLGGLSITKTSKEIEKKLKK